MIVYIGIAGDRNGKGLYDRVWNFHCNGAVNNSSLRHSIAKYLGLPILYKKTSNGNESTASTSAYVLEENKALVDLKINDFLLDAQWKFIVIEDEQVRKNFEGWLIHLYDKPLLNNKLENFKILDLDLFTKMFDTLDKSPKYGFSEIAKKAPLKAGVYVLYKEHV